MRYFKLSNCAWNSGASYAGTIDCYSIDFMLAPILARIKANSWKFQVIYLSSPHELLLKALLKSETYYRHSRLRTQFCAVSASLMFLRMNASDNDANQGKKSKYYSKIFPLNLLIWILRTIIWTIKSCIYGIAS